MNAIKKLKERDGNNIIVFGSHKLLETLTNENLIDEYQLYIYPLVRCAGKRLFEEGDMAKELTLQGSKTFGSGVVHITYKVNR